MGEAWTGLIWLGMETCGNETSGSIKCGVEPDKLRNCLLPSQKGLCSMKFVRVCVGGGGEEKEAKCTESILIRQNSNIHHSCDHLHTFYRLTNVTSQQIAY